MCKHVAAVLYGVGARLDRQPELLFVLRKVDHLELIEKAGNIDKLVRADDSRPAQKTLADDQLAEVFGIDLAPEVPLPTPTQPPRKSKSGNPAPTRTSRPANPVPRAAKSKVDPNPRAARAKGGKTRKEQTQRAR